MTSVGNHLDNPNLPIRKIFIKLISTNNIIFIAQDKLLYSGKTITLNE